MGGQPRSRHQTDRHDPPLRRAGDIDDLGFIKDRDGHRLVDLLGQMVEPRLDDLGQGQGGQRTHAEPQDPRCQAEEFSVIIRIAEFVQRQQASTRRGAVETGRFCNLRDG